ncbi:hypothetical protein T12_11582 [Trichinella patagoniensis]|uniref:Uncharacterized protein n=1 Tax=Trichinella patagoniensis TaxID=990121 RepID=A0A0V0ZEF1_9BILA|nr:hypothetical protein T12_11582 [Trichinella patagoniensis]
MKNGCPLAGYRCGMLMTTDHQYTKRSLWLPIYQFKGITLLLLSKINFSIFIKTFVEVINNKMRIVTEWFKEFIC